VGDGHYRETKGGWPPTAIRSVRLVALTRMLPSHEYRETRSTDESCARASPNEGRIEERKEEDGVSDPREQNLSESLTIGTATGSAFV